jgi:hypothetical protein
MHNNNNNIDDDNNNNSNKNNNNYNINNNKHPKITAKLYIKTKNSTLSKLLCK